MHLRHSLILGASVAVAWVMSATQVVANNQRYHVVFRDGKSLQGRDLRDVYQRGRPPRLNGRDLFDKNNPALNLHDTEGSVQLEAPFVEFTNGDILPGAIAEFRPQRNAAASDAHYLVTMREPWVISHRKDQHLVTRVRSRMVRRVVRWGDVARDYVPGLVVLRSGKHVIAKSIRLSDDTLRVLTKAGIQTIRLDHVAEFHLPNRDSFAATAVDLHWNRLSEQTPLDTVRTADGGRITFPYSMVQRDSHWVVVMPVWSMDALAIRYEMIVTHTFRPMDALPLESLPVATTSRPIRGRSYRWRRNRSVNGAILASGELSVDSGIGVHGTAAVAFSLPKGAVEFEGYVGLNRSVGNGGCVKCVVAKDASDGHKLWQSGHLRGSDGIRRVGPLGVKGAKTIHLMSDMAHQGRPRGADPLDIRDHVDWLLPRVKFDGESISNVRVKGSPWLAGLHGWKIRDEDRKRFSMRPVWHNHRWHMLLWPGAGQKTQDMKPFVIERDLDVTLANAWLKLDATRDPTGHNEYKTKLIVNDQPVAHAHQRDINPSAFHSNQYDTPAWSLADYIGQRVKLEVHFEPLQRHGHPPAALYFSSCEPRPLFRDVLKSGEPIVPDVPLSSLKHTINHESHEPVRGKSSGGKPLVINGYAFAEGFGLRVLNEDVQIKYEVKPDWKRFVAVLGCLDGGSHALGYKILVDGKQLWSSKERFIPWSRGLQIDIEVPAKSKTLELVVEGDHSHALFGNAGFMKGR